MRVREYFLSVQKRLELLRWCGAERMRNGGGRGGSLPAGALLLRWAVLLTKASEGKMFYTFVLEKSPNT